MSNGSRRFLNCVQNGETLVVAEGYLFEMEARGYLQQGAFVPEVILEHPEKVEDLYREFVHAGSDVVLAFTYYAHREKLRLIGKEADLERMNRTALKLARKVADDTGTLMAGNISNTTVNTKDNHEEVTAIFNEQVQWAKEEGADFIVGETFMDLKEAMMALTAIKRTGLPAVITMFASSKGIVVAPGGDAVQDAGPALQQLYDAGAAVVGFNCSRGPETMLDSLKLARNTYKGPLAALPVAYRTNSDYPSFLVLPDVTNKDKLAFPVNLDAWFVQRSMMEDFAKQAHKLGVTYIGICCGNRPNLTRSLAEGLGRQPPASRYSPDLSKHWTNITDDRHWYNRSHYLQQFKTKDK